MFNFLNMSFHVKKIFKIVYFSVLSSYTPPQTWELLEEQQFSNVSFVCLTLYYKLSAHNYPNIDVCSLGINTNININLNLISLFS